MRAGIATGHKPLSIFCLVKNLYYCMFNFRRRFVKKVVTHKWMKGFPHYYLRLSIVHQVLLLQGDNKSKLEFEA